MNLDDALSQAAGQGSEAGEVLRFTGTLEPDSVEGKVRVYPTLGSRRHYVLLDRDSVTGDVLDVTDSVREKSPAQVDPIFSVPVAKGSEIQLVSVTTITVDDPEALRTLSFDQTRGAQAERGSGCGCGGHGGGGRDTGSFGCRTGTCEPVGGGSYPCSEIDPSTGLVYCSGCCAVAAK